jgi:L-iditol 2-dehydrogenase
LTRRMRAAVLHGREDVRVEVVELLPLEPGEILLRTRAALTCGTDVKVFRRGYHARMLKPPALFGHEVAGTVEEVGPGVEGVRPGERVVVANSAPCSVCSPCLDGREGLCDDLLFWNGAYAEFARIPARIVEKNLVPIDPGVDFRMAAMAEPLACALRGIEQSDVAAGHTVAVIGAGSIGLMLLVLARLRGARVIVVGRNAGRLAKARELGAHEVIDASEFADVAMPLRQRGRGGLGPDVVIEAAGMAETAEAAIRAVRKGGLVNLFAGWPADARVALDALRMHYEELTVTSAFHHTPASFRAAYRLIADREVDPAAFITDVAPLDEVPEVLRRMARGGDGLKTAILPWGE